MMIQTSLHKQPCELDQARFLVGYLRSMDFHVGVCGENPDEIELYARHEDTLLSREVLSQLGVLRTPILDVLMAEPKRWKLRRRKRRR